VHLEHVTEEREIGLRQDRRRCERRERSQGVEEGHGRSM
jgi:hypothetical protein